MELEGLGAGIGMRRTQVEKKSRWQVEIDWMMRWPVKLVKLERTSTLSRDYSESLDASRKNCTGCL